MAKIAGKRRKKAELDQDRQDFSPHLHFVIALQKNLFFYRHFLFFSPPTILSFICEYTVRSFTFPHSSRLSSFPLGIFSLLLPSPPLRYFLNPQRLSPLVSTKKQKSVFPPSSCLSVPSLAPLLSALLCSPPLTQFFHASLLWPPPPLFSSSSPAGYCCSLCLFLKDYLCSHSDKGFGKGSLSAPSFRRWAPCMGGEYMKEAGCVQVCVRACVCVYLSVLVVCIRTCVCVRSLECWAVIKSKRSQQCEWRLLLLTHAQMRITLTNVPPLRAPIFIFFCVVSQNCTTDVAASDNRAVGKSRGEKKRNFFGPSRP